MTLKNRLKVDLLLTLILALTARQSTTIIMSRQSYKEQEKAKKEVADNSSSDSDDIEEEELRAATARNQRLEQSILENQRRTREAILAAQEAELEYERLQGQFRSLENEIAVRRERVEQWKKAAEAEKKNPGNKKEE